MALIEWVADIIVEIISLVVFFMSSDYFVPIFIGIGAVGAAISIAAIIFLERLE